MSEMNLGDFVSHLPDDHKAKLQFKDFQNTVIKYLELQQEVWKLRADLADCEAKNKQDAEILRAAKKSYEDHNPIGYDGECYCPTCKAIRASDE